MDERRLDARRSDRLQERVDDRGIRRRRAEWDVVVGNVGGLGSGDVPVDVRPLLRSRGGG